MAIQHAQPGEVIELRPSETSPTTARTAALLKGRTIEVVRIVMAKDKTIAEHRAPGEITIHGLEGIIAVTALENRRELRAGQLLFLGAGEPHSVECLEDAVFLLTIARAS